MGDLEPPFDKGLNLNEKKSFQPGKIFTSQFPKQDSLAELKATKTGTLQKTNTFFQSEKNYPH